MFSVSFLHPQFSSLFEPHPKFIVVELMPGVLKGSLTSTLSHDWAVINTAVLDRAQQTDENTLMYKHVYIRGNNPIQSKYAPSGHARRLLQDLQPKPNAVSAMSLVTKQAITMPTKEIFTFSMDTGTIDPVTHGAQPLTVSSPRICSGSYGAALWRLEPQAGVGKTSR